MSRHIRVTTRSGHQNDLKRVMHSTSKVRKWEKKWVRVDETSLQIFKWMPIKSEDASPQATTPIQQLQEQADVRKENIENIDQKNTTTNNNRPTSIGRDNKSLAMQTGSAASMNTGNTNGLYVSSTNGQQHHNGTAPQQNGDCSQNYNHQQIINNKHSLTSDYNDDSLLNTSAEFPPTKRQRTMPGPSSFLGLGGDHQSSVPILMSEVKVIDSNDSSLHNSSSSNLSQMNPTTTLLTNTGFAQPTTTTTTIGARPPQAKTDNNPLTCSAAAGDDISQQSQPDDIEMMEAEITSDNLPCITAHAHSTDANNTIDMGDLSDIARAVTEQIVTKVSSYQGII